jgi:Fur family ferric uptake transcriptional regulator
MGAEFYSDLLLKHEIRPTANRILVVKTMEEAGRPLSMMEIEERLVTIDKSIVSRTLTLLREHHAVHVIEGAHEGLRYEICHSHHEDADTDTHAHFYCESCHRTFCLDHVPVPEVLLPDGFKVITTSFLAKGICPECAEKG